MVFAIGMRLAEVASEHLGVFLLVIVTLWLALLWPRVVRFIEDRRRR